MIFVGWALPTTEVLWFRIQARSDACGGLRQRIRKATITRLKLVDISEKYQCLSMTGFQGAMPAALAVPSPIANISHAECKNKALRQLLLIIR
ncbi:MAG: hypothetical protein HEQ35_13095 [Gloeotrichia echinulata IR180]